MRLALVLAFAASAAFAQAGPDPMEVQRCVWRCLADSRGADDPAYGACVAAQCSVGPVAAPEAPVVAPAADWVYGDHPALGRGAFAQFSQGVIGLACGSAGYPLDLRLTNGLFRGQTTTILFVGSEDAVSIGKAPGPASQRSGDSCELALDGFREASTMVLVEGTIASVTRDAYGQIVTVQSGGRLVPTRSGGDALTRLGGLAASLSGSAAAIERLLADCPAARADDAYVCED